jgi:hypothetical protein
MVGLHCYVSLALLVRVAFALPQRQQKDGLLACGRAFYYADKVRVYVCLIVWRQTLIRSA